MTAEPFVEHGPVTDWATDFDHADPEYNRRAHEIWNELRDSCPVARTERYGGTWLPVTHDLVHEIAYDTEQLHQPRRRGEQRPSRRAGADRRRSADHERPAVPSDRPPAVAAAVRAEADRAVGGRDTPALPRTPRRRWARSRRRDRRRRRRAVRPAHPGERDLTDARASRSRTTTCSASSCTTHSRASTCRRKHRQASFDRLDEYVTVQIDDHIANPRDDLTSFLLSAEIDGQPLEREHVAGSIVLLLLAGIDTTWSAIGSALWHLASHPDDRRRMLAEPEILPFAIEELLRAYAPVTMARLVAKDHDFHGCPMKVG